LKAACKKTASFRGHFCEALVARNLLPKALQHKLLPIVVCMSQPGLVFSITPPCDANPRRKLSTDQP